MVQHTLSSGPHRSLSDGVCLMELVSLLGGDPWSPYPACASGVLTDFGSSANDGVLDDCPHLEPRLRALAPRIVGTAGRPERDRAAAALVVTWCCRVVAPAVLRLARLEEHAARLQPGPQILTPADVPVDDLENAHRAADAAWESANAAAQVPAWSPPVHLRVGSPHEHVCDESLGFFVRCGVWPNALEPVWGAFAAGVPAGRDAFWGMAFSSVRCALVQAAWDAVRAEPWDATAPVDHYVARRGFSAILDPVLRPLQHGAVDLLERMVALYD